MSFSISEVFYLRSIITILREYIESIKQRLFDDERINKVKDRIHSEAWANDNGVALGAISYLSNPSDEAISFTIDVQQKKDYVLVWIGIY